jgi:sodium/hydrogen exchanger 10/11
MQSLLSLDGKSNSVLCVRLQVLLTGLISFSVAFVLIGYVVLKFNAAQWDVQSCLLFSITLGVIDPVHSVKSLKTIGMSELFVLP